MHQYCRALGRRTVYGVFISPRHFSCSAQLLLASAVAPAAQGCTLAERRRSRPARALAVDTHQCCTGFAGPVGELLSRSGHAGTDTETVKNRDSDSDTRTTSSSSHTHRTDTHEQGQATAHTERPREPTRSMHHPTLHRRTPSSRRFTRITVRCLRLLTRPAPTPRPHPQRTHSPPTPTPHTSAARSRACWTALV